MSLINRSRVTVALGLLFLSASSVWAQTRPDLAGFYRGMIGDELAVTLTFYADGDGFAGQYRYVRHGQPIGLTAEKTETNEVVLKEYDWCEAKDRPAPQWRGVRDDGGVFVWRWTSGDGKRELPVRLDRIAKLKVFERRTSQYESVHSVPSFTAGTPFYAAINERMAREAEDQVKAGARELAKLGEHDAAMPYAIETTYEILHADESLVSLLGHRFEFTGGAHGNSGFSSTVYLWRKNKLVRAKARDIFAPGAAKALRGIVIKDLKRQGASWPDDIKFADLDQVNWNPTSRGLVFTFSPYEAGSFAEGRYTVLIPYAEIKGLMAMESPVQRLMVNREN